MISNSFSQLAKRSLKFKPPQSYGILALRKYHFLTGLLLLLAASNLYAAQNFQSKDFSPYPWHDSLSEGFTYDEGLYYSSLTPVAWHTCTFGALYLYREIIQPSQHQIIREYWKDIGGFTAGGIACGGSLGVDEYICTDGAVWNIAQKACLINPCADGESYDEHTGQCLPSAKQPDCPKSENPISFLTGYKYKQQTDIPTSVHNLGFQRYYRSGAVYGLDTVFGGYWRHQYEQRIKLHPLGQELVVITANGRQIPFHKTGAAWTGDTDSTSTLTELFDASSNRIGWQHHTSNNQIEQYNAQGQITSITYLNGNKLTFDYALDQTSGGDDNTLTLDKVTDASGHSIQFAYTGHLLTRIIDQDGLTYRYEYNSDNHLNKVIYPDDTPQDNTDNPSRIYHYEDTNHPALVTGITDETGQRTDTWIYDAQGRAISSEKGSSGSGISLTTVDYTYMDDPTDPRVTVTNALGKQTTFHYTTVAGVRKVTQIEGHASTYCAAGNQNTTYDANGFKSSTTDWNGNQTTYSYNSRGLETERIEAVGTSAQRKTVTQWHTIFRLPTQIDVFDHNNTLIKRTTNTYDTQGRRLNQTIESY